MHRAHAVMNHGWLSSVVFDNLDIEDTGVAPFKAQAPLVVDVDAVLSGTIAHQGFKAVAGWARVRIKEAGPGYCHFPLAYDQRYFEGLTAERVRTKFVRGHAIREWFLPSGRRNEPLDIRVYSLATLLARQVSWARLGEEAGAPWAAGPAPKAFVRRVRREWL